MTDTARGLHEGNGVIVLGSVHKWAQMKLSLWVSLIWFILYNALAYEAWGPEAANEEEESLDRFSDPLP